MKLKQQLKYIKSHGKSQKERVRAHAILLYEEGYKKVKIAEILGVTARTVFKWFAEYKLEGISSFKRVEGQGRKNLIDKDKYFEIIKHYISDYPNQPKKAYSLTVNKIGINMSYDTFKRFLKKYSI